MTKMLRNLRKQRWRDRSQVIVSRNIWQEYEIDKKTQIQ